LFLIQSRSDSKYKFVCNNQHHMVENLLLLIVNLICLSNASVNVSKTQLLLCSKYHWKSPLFFAPYIYKHRFWMKNPFFNTWLIVMHWESSSLTIWNKIDYFESLFTWWFFFHLAIKLIPDTSFGVSRYLATTMKLSNKNWISNEISLYILCFFFNSGLRKIKWYSKKL